MITVADIMALPAFKEVECLTPIIEGNQRIVRNVGILDTPPHTNAYDDFFPGDFVVTNLGFAFNDTELAERSLTILMERNVAAIGIRNFGNMVFTNKLIEASQKTRIPIYLYKMPYNEVIAYQALDLIRRDEQQSDKSHLIDNLLSDHNDTLTREKLFELGGLTGATIQFAAIKPRNTDECSLYALLDLAGQCITDFKRDVPGVVCAFSCRYRDSVVMAITYDRPAESLHPESQTELARRLSSLGTYVGIGEEGSLSDGDLGLREALAALDTAVLEKNPLVSWTNLRFDAFRSAGASSRLFCRVANFHQRELRAYDAERGTELFDTCVAVTRAFGDLKEAAEALCVHINTVRYRIGKVKSVFKMEDYSEREFMTFLQVVFLEQSDPRVGREE